MYDLLIVEDELSHRKGLAALISKLRPNWNIELAANGKSALEIINQIHLDVVITDIQMPALDGLNLLEAINLLDQKPITIILSGYNLFEYAQRALSLGAFDYLLKPIDTDKTENLLCKLEKVLKAKQESPLGLKLTTTDNKNDSNPVDDTLIQSCISFIHSNISNNTFSLNAVAQEYHFSTSYFSSWFKKRTNENFNRYLTRIRMEKAAEFIKSDIKIYKVATMVGFQDVKYFCRVFKQFYNVTPDEFRHKKNR